LESVLCSQRWKIFLRLDILLQNKRLIIFNLCKVGEFCLILEILFYPPLLTFYWRDSEKVTPTSAKVTFLLMWQFTFADVAVTFFLPYHQKVNLGGKTKFVNNAKFTYFARDKDILTKKKFLRVYLREELWFVRRKQERTIWEERNR
jgi:hypothetical protein